MSQNLNYTAGYTDEITSYYHSDAGIPAMQIPNHIQSFHKSLSRTIANNELGELVAVFYYPNWYRRKLYFKQGKRIIMYDSTKEGLDKLVYKKAIPTKINGMTGGWL